MRVEVRAEQCLELNATSECLSSVLAAVAHFRQFHEVTVEKADNDCVGVRNCTGVRGSFRVESDAGVQALAEEHRARLAREAVDEPVLCGLARVALQPNDGCDGVEERVAWVELHRTAPTVRVFQGIPFQRDAGKCFLCGNEPWAEGNGLCFENEADAHKGRTVVLSMENEAERDAWRAVLDKGVVSRLPSQLAPRAADSGELPATGELVVTALPAHPSVTLQFYGQPYRHVRERVLAVRLDGFAPFTLPVDSVTTCAVLLRRDDSDASLHHDDSDASLHNDDSDASLHHDDSNVALHNDDSNASPHHTDSAVVVQACVEKGRKVLVLSAPLELTNNTDAPLQCGFIPSEAANGAVPTHERVWASLEVVRSGGVFVQGATMKAIPMQLIRAGRGSGLLNIGLEQQPFYVMVHAEMEAVPVLRQPAQTVPLYRLYLSSVLEIENLVPEAVEYRVIDARGHVFACCALKAGEKATLTSLKFRREEGLRVSVRVVRSDFEFSAYEQSIFVCVFCKLHS